MQKYWRSGVGREQAHEAIKEHAVAAALAMREEAAERNDLVERLEADDRLGLGTGALGSLIDDPLSFTGNAVAQTAAFCQQVAAVVARHPEAASYDPAPIL